jgi:putative transposase
MEILARGNGRSHRLRGHDYTSPGSYFVTLCVENRECLFGDIVDGIMRLNAFGRIVHDEWFITAVIRPEISLDAFVVMPNHIHGIIVIHEFAGDPATLFHNDVRMHNVSTTTDFDSAGADGHPRLRRPPRSLGSIVVGFKSATVKKINDMRQSPGRPVWQRNYHDRIIRTDASLNRVRRYIAMNPLKWELDRKNPVKFG